MSAFYIILSLLLWGLVHSILASLGFKSFLANLLGDAPMRGYRLFYNVFSFLSFLPILYLVVALPDARLYSVSAPLSYAMMFGQGVMVILLVVGVLQTGMLTFAGLRQLIEGERPPKFMWLSPQVTVNSFTLYIAAMIYIFIGAYFEERKLAREFGAAYAEYRSKTPMFIPCLKG
ncbi:MAG: hypothetical protein DCC54_04325 [Anaerolineae bacterium]|nr:MAG: hypothetical protein DCC54_04325 [Anaerolineae bacterium]